jgi:dCMP deaminase
MKDPDRLWYDICLRFAQQSRCRSRQVGCVIVRNDILIGEGWNSPPRGSDVVGCEKCNGNCKPGEKLESAICAHAEANAIANCARNGHPTDGSTMYCTTFSCKYCASLIVAAGIREFVYMEEYANWEGSQILQKAGIIMRKIDPWNEWNAPAGFDRGKTI